jgi:hypothetical protein
MEGRDNFRRFTLCSRTMKSLEAVLMSAVSMHALSDRWWADVRWEVECPHWWRDGELLAKMTLAL